MRPILATSIVLLCGAVAAPAASAAAPPSPAERSAKREANELFNRAHTQVQRSRPACAPARLPSGDGAPLTDADPSAALRSVLAPFRRAPTAAEVAAAEARQPPGLLLLLPGTQERSRRGMRTLRAADGRELWVTAVPKVVQPGIDPAIRRACADSTREIATSLAQSARPAVRRELKRVLDAQRSAARHATPAQEGEGLALYVPRLGGGGGGSTGTLFDPAQFAARGMFLSTGGGVRAGVRSHLAGVVPDGVATVELEYPQRASRGPKRQPVDYGSAHRQTVVVQENAVSVTVPRRTEDAFAPRMVWRAADGSVVRVVREP